MPANPLASVHAEMGAFLVERAGTRVPARFGEVAAEHDAVRKTVGIFDLASAGRFWISGRERTRFLHGLLAVDVAALSVGRGRYALLLTREARIASELRIAALEDRYLLLTPSMSRVKVHRTLERHRVASDVSIDDATEAWTLLSVQGPATPFVVAAALGTLVPSLPPRGAAEIRTARMGNVVLVRSPRTGEEGLDLLVPATAAAALFRRLVDEARAAGGVPCGIDALDALRVETGRPTYGAEIDETTLLTDMPEIAPGIDLAKGCFLGRVEAERMLQDQQPHCRVVGLVFGSAYPPVRGDKLKLGARVVGRVTSACASPTLGRAIALGIVDADVAQPGKDLETWDGERATVTELPFVPPKLA